MQTFIKFDAHYQHYATIQIQILFLIGTIIRSANLEQWRELYDVTLRIQTLK